MSLKDNITKEFGPALSKAVMSALVSSLSRSSHGSSEESSSSDFSSSWKEIEQKLQGLFSNEDETSPGKRNTGLLLRIVALVGVIALVYLYGRHRGRKQTSVLEVHKA